MEYLTNTDEKKESPLSSNAKRLAIAFVFEQLGAPHNTQEEPWSSKGSHKSISAVVKRNLFISPGTDTTTIFQE
jgi:hypothetical protein